MNNLNPAIPPSKVTKNAGKIQNLLTNLGIQMGKTITGNDVQAGSGFHSREEIAESIINAERAVARRLNIKEEQPQPFPVMQTDYYNYPQPMQYPQPQGVMPPYPITPPQRTNFNFTDNFTIEEDMETIDISKYIGAPKKEQSKAPKGDMVMLVKEIRETNKKLEAMCKILGLIYQQNVKNNTVTPADYGFNDVEPSPQNVEEEMTIEEETEMLKNLANIPPVDPLAEDDDDDSTEQ